MPNTQTATKQYSVSAKVTFETTITVEAGDIDEARAKAESGEWSDDGILSASRTDWKINTRQMREEDDL